MDVVDGQQNFVYATRSGFSFSRPTRPWRNWSFVNSQSQNLGTREINHGEHGGHGRIWVSPWAPWLTLPQLIVAIQLITEFWCSPMLPCRDRLVHRVEQWRFHLL
jgi:hypothetical protein